MDNAVTVTMPVTQLWLATRHEWSAVARLQSVSRRITLRSGRRYRFFHRLPSPERLRAGR
ncbi:MAG: hypothetical protein KKG09_02495 [Verrucomicrobia bacterium]|nr:hypothetical protein [Verrucomicrobiota bacterium]MCG2681514.1 hypothetical protein [Kiritimatiellia bacterium]MBU4247356.1 hypothetical protein [Verrucomicrobiota bacterium]MBU4289975.1 hypothetical protein [Verrucomicrobiota bacterium]MBU4428964.1 hypothetical protein [Verrucomicrobiota bacterium]